MAKEEYQIQKLIKTENTLRLTFKLDDVVHAKLTDEIDGDDVALIVPGKGFESFLTNIKATSRWKKREKTMKVALKRQEEKFKNKMESPEMTLIRQMHEDVLNKRKSIKVARNSEIARLIKEFIFGRYKERFGASFEEVAKYMFGTERLRECMQQYHVEIKVVR